jgi:mannose-1-phosphate guanylyltransferase
MAGGRGERFWPQSRHKMPKQLLPIVGNESLLAQAVHRVEGIVPLSNVFVITNADYADAVAEACPILRRANIVAEPVGRDTASAVGLGGVLARLGSPDASLAVLPSDHVIHDVAAFRLVLTHAFEAAESGDWLVTIGIKPEFPATGYGYIHRGDECMRLEGLPVYKVRRFVEKPNLELARQYVDSGEFFWNAGMFVWSAKSFFAALEKHAPDIAAGLGAIERELSQGCPMADVLVAHYPHVRKISIDFALMEKAENVLTLPALFDWDDVGAWPSLARHLPADAAGNILRGNAVVLDGHGNIVISTGDHLVSVMGISNCIVVHTGDVTMVCPRDRAQDIRLLVKQVAANPDWSDRI